LAVGLRAHGFKVDIASPSGAEAAHVAKEGFRHVPFELRRRLGTISHLRTIRQLRLIIKTGRYDIVHLHGPITATLGRVASLRSRSKVVYHCRGGTLFGEPVDIGMTNVLRRLYPWMERALAPVTDLVFTLNEEDAADFVTRASYRASRVECLGVGGCGIDLKFWNGDQYSAAQRRALKERFGIPADRTVVGFVGRIVQEKGILDLLEAFYILRKANRDVHLLVVGNTPDSERDQLTQRILKERVAQYSLNAFVSFPGYLHPARDAIAAMDVLCLPSSREGFGHVVAEARALGIPRVAASSRGTRRAIVDQLPGLLVEKGDIVGLSASIRRLVDDPALAQRMGAEAARRVRSEMSQDEVLNRVIGAYRRLMS